MNNSIIIAANYCGLCNTIKNLLSCIRIKNNNNNITFLIDKNNSLINLFEFTDTLIYDNNIINTNECDIIIRNHWRFTIFDNDINLDKIINNNISLMFKDFNENSLFKNYNNNCIDLLYRPDLFSNIYEEYSNIFNELIIKKEILNNINDFYNKHFNKYTISVHLRTWTDCNERKLNFDINKFYEKIEELNNGINNFFICSDDKNISYNIKKKFGNNIIIYEENTYNSSLINAFIELILLSKNNILIGTFLSTFTELAYIINYNIDKKIYII